MMGLILSNMEYLWAIPFLLIVYFLWKRFSKVNYIATTTLTLLEPVLVPSSRLRRLPTYLLVIALVLIIMALTSPTLPFSERQIETRGIDISIVLDLSQSMQEIMTEPDSESGETDQSDKQMMSLVQEGKTRLEVTKEAMKDFISRRNEDRIAFIVFSNNAYVVSPLTFDYEYLLYYIDMIDENILLGEGMTAIGEGISLARLLLLKQRESEQRKQIILVYTDGEHNIGSDPLAVLPQVNALGINTYIVGIDLEEKIRNNEALTNLIEAVEGSGGKYFDAASEEELFTVSREVDSMERHTLVSNEFVRHKNVYYWFVLPALALIVIALVLRTAPYFSDYT